MRARLRATTALTAALTVALALPAMAQAAKVTVTGDAGNPVALTPGAPATIRNMDVRLGATFDASEEYYAMTVTGPVGPAASPNTCSSGGGFGKSVDYQGNGTYTVGLTTYTDYTCDTKVRSVVVQYVVAAGVSMTPPAGKVLTRQPNSYSAIDYNIPIALNPGALGYEVRMAKGGVRAPDGSISGPSEELFASSSTGTVGADFETPGSYLIVARAKGYTGTAGQYFTPWSAPIVVTAIAPFDFDIGFPKFTDGRGPSYKLKVKLQERSATGKVRLKVKRGKHGRYKSIGKAKIRHGKFKKRFTLRRTGRYRLKYIYKGSATVAPGTVEQKFRIVRRRFV